MTNIKEVLALTMAERRRKQRERLKALRTDRGNSIFSTDLEEELIDEDMRYGIEVLKSELKEGVVPIEDVFKERVKRKLTKDLGIE